MESPNHSQRSAIDALVQKHPHIPCTVPSSPEYTALRSIFMVDNLAMPIAITRPQTAEHVSLIVSFCVSHRIPFVVRSGGNNLFGKSLVDGALTIDMRDIKFCHVDDSKTSARIGGGILAGKLVDDLSTAGVMTASGTVPFIGYVGWSTYGGYGPFSGKFGYGFEQIIAAKIVNWKGEVVEADAELLSGIRGAGGSFGVIVEMTIKVYPLTNIFSGLMIYNAADIGRTVTSYNRGLQKLHNHDYPRQLYVAPLFLYTEDGLKLASHFMWGDDNKKDAMEWLEKVSNFGEVLHNPVRQSTVLDCVEEFKKTVPPDGRGSVNTISLRVLTEETTAIMAKYVANMPRYVGNGFAIHVAPKPADSSLENSVFATAERHFMLEILGTPRSEAGVEESRKWVADFLRELQQTDPNNIIPTTYINHTPPGRSTLKQIYADKFPTVMALKEKHDPNNVFNLAVPFSYIPIDA